MAHPYADEAKTGQEMAKARYAGEIGTKGDASQRPEEEWTAAPARQVSNLGKVRT